jgi:hypothetical protein
MPIFIIRPGRENFAWETTPGGVPGPGHASRITSTRFEKEIGSQIYFREGKKGIFNTAEPMRIETGIGSV